MHRFLLLSFTFIALVSSVAIQTSGAVAQRFLFPETSALGISSVGVLGEDLSELLTYIPESFLNELFNEDDFPDPFEYDLDEMQRLEESLLGGGFPFGLKSLANHTNRNTVRAASCNAENAVGTCIDTSACTGKSVPGYCSGAKNIQCCIPSGSPCSANGKSGVCIQTSACSGTPVAGFCSGPSSIQCCIAGGSSTGSSSGSACGNYAGAPTSTITGNGNKLYTVLKIKQEHLSNPNSYFMAPDKSDNTITPSTACAFDKMLTAAKASGIKLTINSGFRTVGRQAYFWNCFQTKRCNGGSPAAPIGTSNHGKGIALDLNANCGKQTGPQPNCGGSRVYQWLKANAHKYGFVRTVKKEPWHWEFRGIGAPIPSYM